MVITLPDARQLSDEILNAIRLRALRGIELGFTPRPARIKLIEESGLP